MAWMAGQPGNGANRALSSSLLSSSAGPVYRVFTFLLSHVHTLACEYFSLDVYAGVCVVGEEREREKDRFVKDPDYIMDYISVLVVSSLVLRPKAKLRTSERSKRQIPG